MEGHLYPLAKTRAVTCYLLPMADYVYTLEAYELCVGSGHMWVIVGPLYSAYGILSIQ